MAARDRSKLRRFELLHKHAKRVGSTVNVARKYVESLTDKERRDLKAASTRAAIETGTEVAAQLFSAVSTVKAFYQIRTAAMLAKDFPEEKRVARAMMLLGAADIVIAGTAVSAATIGAYMIPRHILGALGASLTVVGLTKAGAGLLNEIDKIAQAWRKHPIRDRMLDIAARACDFKPVAKVMDALLAGVSLLDRQSGKYLNGLRGAYDKKANADIWKALDDMDEILAIYAKSYDASEVESKEAMHSYLTDPEDKWNLYTIGPEGNKYGFFTAYTITDKKGQKHLLVEQVVPPIDVDMQRNLEAWKEIRNLAKEMDAKRIWLECRKTEPMPEGFRESLAYHEQPPLKGQAATSMNLRMAVHTCGNGPLSKEEYLEVVCEKWMDTWYDGILDNPEYQRIRHEIEASLPEGKSVPLIRTSEKKVRNRIKNAQNSADRLKN